MRSADHETEMSKGRLMKGHRERKIFAGLGAASLALLLATAECAAATAGFVKVAEGTATVTRGNQTMPAAPGLPLEEGDVLKTGADGQLGVVLRDDTRVSLGPDTEVRIDRFVFAPAQGQLALVLKMARGVAAYVSGKIAQLSPDAVRVETPVATVGVRGTRFVAKVPAP
jgi:hypothetical protein